jgi:hypothetical protein
MALDIWQSHACFTLALFLLLPTSRLRRSFQLLALLVLFAVSCIAIDKLALAAYLRSVIGPLAMTTLLMMGAVALLRLRVTNISCLGIQHVAFMFAALGLMMYPAALGLTQFDPYRLGYDPELMLIVVGAFAAWFLYSGNHFGAWLLALATVAFIADLQASDNYWDYLLDPFLVVFCWSLVARRAYGMLMNRVRRLSRINPVGHTPVHTPIADVMTQDGASISL